MLNLKPKLGMESCSLTRPVAAQESPRGCQNCSGIPSGAACTMCGKPQVPSRGIGMHAGLEFRAKGLRYRARKDPRISQQMLCGFGEFRACGC